MTARTANEASTATSHCPHCGVPVDGPADVFCCPGCELAAAIIQGSGLEAYYAERVAPAPRPVPLAADWSAVAVEAMSDGTTECRLAIDGLRCASCVWVVEGVLERTEGVAQAHVSYATGRATLRFDPERVDLPTLGARIAALGYRPRPVDAAPTSDRDLLTRLGVAAFCAANCAAMASNVPRSS